MSNTGSPADEAAQVALRTRRRPRAPDRGWASVLVRGKGGKPRRCPLWGETVRGLAALVAGRGPSEHMFLNRCGRPLTRFGIHTLVERFRGPGGEAGAVPGRQASKPAH